MRAIMISVYMMIISALIFLATTAFAGRADVITAAKYASAQTGVPYKLLVSMAYVESRFNHGLIGGVGERGMLQMRPEFHGTNHLQSLKGHFYHAAVYIKDLKRLCSNLGNAYFICYNLGPNKARKLFSSFDKAAKFKYYEKVMEANSVLFGRAALQNKSKIRYQADATQAR